MNYRLSVRIQNICRCVSKDLSSTIKIQGVCRKRDYLYISMEACGHLSLMTTQILLIRTTCYVVLPAIRIRDLLPISFRHASGSIYPHERPRVAPWLLPASLVPGLTHGVLVKLVEKTGSKKQRKESKPRSYKLQLGSTNELVFWSLPHSLPTSNLSSNLPLGSRFVLLLHLLCQRSV